MTTDPISTVAGVGALVLLAGVLTPLQISVLVVALSSLVGSGFSLAAHKEVWWKQVLLILLTVIMSSVLAFPISSLISDNVALPPLVAFLIGLNTFNINSLGDWLVGLLKRKLDK